MRREESEIIKSFLWYRVITKISMMTYTGSVLRAFSLASNTTRLARLQVKIQNQNSNNNGNNNNNILKSQVSGKATCKHARLSKQHPPSIVTARSTRITTFIKYIYT